MGICFNKEANSHQQMFEPDPEPVKLDISAQSPTPNSSVLAKDTPAKQPLRVDEVKIEEPRESAVKKVVVDRTNSKWIVGESDSIEDHYEIGKTIGQPGQFGQAYLVKSKSTGETKAVKVINKSKFRSKRDRMYHFESLRAEIEIMQELSHKNIIKFFEVYETLSNLYIVMECCSGGELFDRIQAKKNGVYSEQDAAYVLRQILEGINYMHVNKIAHCDLKPDNFLFLDDAEDADLKIIDFGMSKILKQREYLKSFRGTPYYIAPEVLEGKYSEHCDMWSYGVVMFVMLYGYPPFHGDTDPVIFQKIAKGFQPIKKSGYGPWFPSSMSISDNAMDLISKCLDTDPAKRFTAKEALEHAWFKAQPSESLSEVVFKNLSEFVSNSKFKQEVLGVMTDYMTSAELAQLGEMFKKMDLNGDGMVTKAELQEALAAENSEFHPENAKAMEAIQKLFHAADVDGDGCLSYTELVNASLHRKLREKEERLWEAFNRFDEDGDGKVSAEEISQVIGKTIQEAQELIAEVDQDGNGTIDYDEFMQMWLHKEEENIPEISQKEA